MVLIMMRHFHVTRYAGVKVPGRSGALAAGYCGTERGALPRSP